MIKIYVQGSFVTYLEEQGFETKVVRVLKVPCTGDVYL